MHFLRPLVLATALICLVGTVLGLPDVIANSEYGIRWLYEEAAAGRFRYDLSRDVPPLQNAWQAFLRDRGAGIVNGH